MADSDEIGKSGRGQALTVSRNQKHIHLDDILRARREGVFVSPCGTEGCRWEGFPEWPEEFPYDAFGDEWGETDCEK